MRNGSYKLLELISEACNGASTYFKTVKRFKVCRIWCKQQKYANLGVIHGNDITNVNGKSSREAGFATTKKVVSCERKNCRLLRSNAAVASNGELNSTAGAQLTAAKVLDELEARTPQQKQVAVNQTPRAREGAELRTQWEIDCTNRDLDREVEKERAAAHATWLALRENSQRQLNMSCTHRRNQEQ